MIMWEYIMFRWVYQDDDDDDFDLDACEAQQVHWHKLTDRVLSN